MRFVTVFMIGYLIQNGGAVLFVVHFFANPPDPMWHRPVTGSIDKVYVYVYILLLSNAFKMYSF